MRASVKIVVMLMFLNAGAELLRAAGIAQAMGINDPGAAAEMNDATSSARDITASGGGLDTLYQLYITATQGVSAIFEFVWSGPSMLINIGVPEPIVVFLFAPLAVVVGIDIVYYLTAR